MAELSGTPVVLLHGIGQAPTSWADVVVRLTGSRPILTPWVPGLEPTDDRSVSIPDAASEIDDRVRLEGWGPVDVVGLSYGAVVATQFAASSADRVRRLVLIAGQVKPPKALLKAQHLALRLVPPSRFATTGVSKERLLSTLAAVSALDLRAVLPHITAPTLILVGSRDRANTPAARALARSIRGAKLQVVDGAGHALNEERPRELAGVLSDFLA
ncbi:MAG: alpha/beta hydrolase [Dermatophilaceae bacterium]